MLALFVALALSSGAILRTSAQEPRDPLIDPPSGGSGSRFQIVGQFGWVPGEEVVLLVAFTTAPDPLTSPPPAPGQMRYTVKVLADGTWSFPLVVDEFFSALGGPPQTPGYIVVRASAPSHDAVNAYIYTVRSVLPAGAEAIASTGAGPGAPSAAVVIVAALFAIGVGALLVIGGTSRRIRRLV